jgi:asparagine synthase (glutamine-hydrolysing)
LLTKVDLASMHTSLEVRVPFLDPSVVKYAFSLPRSYVMNARTRKRILKQVYEPELPEEILTRSKQGFDMPIGEWFKGPLAADFKKVIDRLETDLLDQQNIRNAYEAHCAGRRERGKFLWAVYVFGKWHRYLRKRGVL